MQRSRRIANQHGVEMEFLQQAADLREKRRCVPETVYIARRDFPAGAGWTGRPLPTIGSSAIPTARSSLPIVRRPENNSDTRREDHKVGPSLESVADSRVRDPSFLRASLVFAGGN